MFYVKARFIHSGTDGHWDFDLKDVWRFDLCARESYYAKWRESERQRGKRGGQFFESVKYH